MVSDVSQQPRQKQKQKILARFEGKIFLPQGDVPFKYSMRRTNITMGRSDPSVIDTNPYKPAKDGVTVGLGLNNKLSRAHCRIEFEKDTNHFFITCLGKNGFTVKRPNDQGEPAKLTPDSIRMHIVSGTVITFSDCVLVFHVTNPLKEDKKSPTSNTNDTPKKRKKRDWIKTEHHALKQAMMRLGYGRWDDIIAHTTGRLAERDPEELIPVAREFVAHCYVHARAGVERKALMEILREEPLKANMTEDDIEANIKELVESRKKLSNDDEARKYIRWARKLRLLSRLRDVHDHPSLERLRKGELRVFTPPPALYWTSADDADLITGSYKHGYGLIDNMLQDPELGFYGRYSRAQPPKKTTTAKTEKESDAVHGSEDDDEDEEDVDDDEDERQCANDDAEDADPHVQNPRKRMKLGVRQGKKGETRVDGVNRGTDDSDVSPSRSPDHKPDDNESEKHSLHDHMEDVGEPETVKKKPVRMVPKRGPRIGNDDGFMDPEDAKAARDKMADKDGLVPFPPSESLMRRLKSIINSCAKEFDRDQRELKKRLHSELRAKQRKDELAARKAEKEAQRTRQREERRIAKSQPFSKKEAVEFEKALSNFGVKFKEDGKNIDWAWFHKKVEGFDAKYDSTLDAAYVELLNEAHRITDLNVAKDDDDHERVEAILESKKPSVVFSTLTSEKAERLTERLQMFRVLRGEILNHKNLTAILRGMKKTRDLPPWWKSCHDRSLLVGVERYGLAGWEFMGMDSDLDFQVSMKTWQKKNMNDVKTMKKATMPKATVGIKRTMNLVRYFRNRASDPHFEYYTRDATSTDDREHPPQNDVDMVGSNGTKSESRTVKMEIMEEKPKAKVELLTRVHERSKLKRKSDALFPPPSTGRPRTLRPTIVEIPINEDGNLSLPSDLGDGLFLLSLGEIRVGEPEFCRNGILFPVGFRTIRQIGSHALLCEIYECDEGRYPEFRVSSLEGFDAGSDGDGPSWTNTRVIGQSINIMNIWLRVVNFLNGDGEMEERVALSCGPERFGLYEPTIVYHIQRLPGAREVKEFELRDFSKIGEGRKIEPTTGILGGMLKALEEKLERPEAIRKHEMIITGQDEGPREPIALASACEMCIPQEWLEKYGGSKKKNRRKSNSYWG